MVPRDLSALLRITLCNALVFLGCQIGSAGNADEDCCGDLQESISELDSACDRCGSCDCETRIVATIDALFLSRTDRSSVQPVVLDTPGNVLLTTNDVDLNNLAVGPRLSVVMAGRDNQAWEAVYFGTQHWHAQAAVNDPANLRIPGELGLASINFIFADQMVVDYSSHLNNVEINRWTRGECWSWLVGARYFNLDETFNIHSVNTFAGESDYFVRSWNNLFGGQLGLERHGQFGRLDWNVVGKAGLFGNSAGQRQLVTDFPPGFVLRDAAARGTSASFVGDVAFTAAWRFSERLSLRGGYNVLWIEGVALAPEQLDFTLAADSGTRLDDHGGVFLHGAHIGLEGRW